MRQLVLITGCSSGIGLATAAACAAATHRVIATMRDPDRRGALDAAAGEHAASICVEQLDVTAADAGKRVQEILEEHGPPHALVNNAGIAVGGVFEEQSDEEIRAQFETNVFGLMAVTRAVLPAMRAAGAGRIINVSSISGLLAFPCLGVYAATKHAVEGLSEALRWEVGPFGIHICLVEPGTHRTPIFFENQRRAAGIALDGPYGAITRAIERVMLEGVERAPPPDAVARTILRLIDAPSPPFRTLVGRDARTLVALRRLLPDRLYAIGMRRVITSR